MVMKPSMKLLVMLFCFAGTAVRTFGMPLSSQSELDFRIVDSIFNERVEYDSCRVILESMMKVAHTPSQKTEVLWRLSRVYTLFGETAKDQDKKREFYEEGVRLAEAAIKSDPSNHNSYMWHSANIGRNCQMEHLFAQASTLPTILADMRMILDTLKRTDCSEAWQGISEIYCRHPFKSTDSGINFARMSVMTIPKTEMRLSAYYYLAGLLYKRNWSAETRESAILKNSRKQKQTSEIEKCAVLDGKLGLDYLPKWSSKGLGRMSDREEADRIVEYAIHLYRITAHHTPMDDDDYAALLKMQKEKGGK